MTSRDRQELADALRRAVADSGAPGAVLHVGDLEGTHFLEAVGDRQRVPHRRAARTDTIYDLASITKVVATTTAVMKLRDAGRFSLYDPISDYVPLSALEGITIEHLLTHTSGLVPFEHYYLTMDSLDEMLRAYAREGVEHPPGVLHRYSDVGFMLLGKLVELTARDTLDAYCRREIFEPLGMSRTAFRPPESWRINIAPTEDDPWRGVLIHGTVHDPNAHAVGGVSGQAGLFSTAEDLAVFCRAFLDARVLPESTVDEMLRFNRIPLYPWQGLGWQMDPWSSKATGFLPSRTAFGHTGWTGTSLWMDRATGFFVILLSNTTHPSRESRDNPKLRRIAHLAVARQRYDAFPTHTGLDRLTRENFRVIEGARYAVLTNHAAVDQQGRHLLEVVDFARNAELAVVFSPEHGLRGQAEAGEWVHQQGGPVPVVSLYGAQKAPTRDQLADIDVFLIDLQDVGARYFTYMATMKRTLEACAAAGVPVVVLDRPNPAGGDVLEGPIATDTSSLVSSAAIPIRHGMTMGELALWFADHDLRESRLNLNVSWLDNWPRAQHFEECVLPWVPPSPNLPTPEAALLYVGTCLFEATKRNEGRGTSTPFSLIGAPWLDAKSVIGRIPPEDRIGATLESVTYTPVSIPGKASNPRFQDELCHGIRIQVADRRAIRPFRLALSLIVALRVSHAESFKLDGSPSLDLLAGGSDLRSRIESGHSASRIVGHYASELAAFDAVRPRLYNDDGIPFEVLEDRD